jgi:AHBA synthesis associated protein
MLDALRTRECRLAIVTSKRRHTTELAVTRFNLAGYFHALVSEPDVPAAKPAPDPILRALELMEASRDGALMVGDSIIDIRTARAAGVRAVAALWGTREDEALLVKGADFVASAPADIVGLVDSSRR